MQEFILKYKNFLEQNLKSKDFETRMRAKIALENLEEFLEAQQELNQKFITNKIKNKNKNKTIKIT